MSQDNGIQLQMNFRERSDENRFRDQIYSAGFSLLFEIPTPAGDADLDSMIRRWTPIRDFVVSQKEIFCGIAFTDPASGVAPYPVIDFASALIPDSRDAHVIYLSGRGKDAEQIAGSFAQCRIEGFKNVVCVSGMPSLKQKNKHVFESVEMLRLNRESDSPLFAGTVVNPYKYEICASLAQSFKLIKKAHAGAYFSVTQFGWDAAKLQEISWQMFRNNCSIPLLARQMLLTPAMAVDLCSGNYPGVRFSRNFQNALRSEMQLSTAQFLAAQWRRFQLNAAGAYFLGYSGIQIGGIESVTTAKMAYQMVLDSLREFNNIQDWLDAVKDYYSQMDIAPYPWRYYLFDNLLQSGVNREDANISRETVPEPSHGELFRYRMAQKLFSKADLHPAAERRLSKKLIVSCKSCNQCRLPQSLFVCPCECPLGFRNGPCGETDVSGKCFLNENECVHAKRIRLAVAMNDYASLEHNIF